MGLTKEDIVDFYKDEAFRCKIGLIFITSLLFLFRKSIFKSMKFYVNKLKKKFFDLPLGKKAKVLDVEVAE